MSDKTFAVVFTGQLVEGAEPERVKANFAQLFKTEVAKVAPLFSGKPVAIKKGLDEATAKKYQLVLHKAGALCQVVNLAAKTAAAKPVSQQEPVRPTAPSTTDASRVPPPAAALEATLAEPGAILKEPEQVEDLQVDTSGLSMGAVGETLVEHEEVADLQVDLAALSMAEAGVQLVEPQSVEVPQIDTDALSMAEAGSILKEPEEVEDLQVDTSELSLS